MLHKAKIAVHAMLFSLAIHVWNEANIGRFFDSVADIGIDKSIMFVVNRVEGAR